MRKRQQGMTAIGMIILVAFIGMVGFGLLQMVPVYLENMRIQKVMNQAKDTLDNQNATVTDIRKALGKGVDIESLYDVDVKSDFQIKRAGDGYTVSMVYQREKAYIANVYLVAKFDHSVDIKR